MLGRDCGRCHLHPPCALHSSGKISRNHRQLHAGVSQLAARRHPGHPVFHPLPQIFREGYARQISLPRSHSHHSGAHLRRRQQGVDRRTGKDTRCVGADWRHLRLCRGHLRLLGRDCLHCCFRLGSTDCRKDKSGVELQHRRSAARPWLHRWSALFVYHLCRLSLRVVGAYPTARHLRHA